MPFALSCTHQKKYNPMIQCAADTMSNVSFSANVIPIFTKNCIQSGCHDGGTAAGHLDLDSAVAYTNLMRAGSGNIDTVTPEASVLYNELISRTDPMPPAYSLDSCTIQLVLKWIKQKAKNN
jgi:hypothetical protein